ncbi:hypothetical protein EPA93_04910 [Ktedonosporobacter rubrisoli]|uniref:Blue (type 1) copper domain-containing protein n=1 Tax=Ktedonosporobacter rubrisoli TaxID=2509675 RepID=A0A4P6JL41_KTERU|nr:plastocyanin/azurin family copper-binding protein [Ktedonosporobacter rubrisoli]QBD75376.1 hypothetical protein EPA93_04910 [Ktedonosporobacter rubrisoli]
MHKLWLALLLICSLLTFAACGGAISPATSTEASSPIVHMDSTSFVQPSITIHKGQRIILSADTAVPHIIANGSWDNGAPKKLKEPGAPEVNDVQINGNSQGNIGPFTTAGTFQLYCTIHPNMQLTVIVQ